MTKKDIIRNIIKGVLGYMYLAKLSPMELPRVGDISGTGFFSYILKAIILILPFYLWIVALAFVCECVTNFVFIIVCLATKVEPHIVMHMRWYDYIPIGGSDRTGLTSQQFMAVRATMDAIRTYNNSSHGPGKY